jgi:hypothetical protein
MKVEGNAPMRGEKNKAGRMPGGFPLLAWLRARGPLPWILLIALAHGLVYVFLVPPWQHYDEPTHFEYAWLIAHRGRLPLEGEYDQSMRRQVALSMLAHDFFRELDFRPDLSPETGPIWIGISQLDEAPLYYLYLSIPLRIVSRLGIDAQLYTARLASLALMLAVVSIVYAALAELLPEGHRLCWMTPLTLALIPGFADLMTSVNNDVGAAAAFSLFLWIGLRIIGRGVTLARVAALMIAAGLCLSTKNTVYLALPMALVALVFGILQGSRRPLAWLLLGLAGGLLPLVLFSWDDAAFWYRHTDQVVPTQGKGREARLGERFLQIEVSPHDPDPRLVQVISREAGASMAGQQVTLGAWIWATRPLQTQGPGLQHGGQFHGQAIQLGQEPRFFALAVKLSPQDRPLRLILAPKVRDMNGSVRIFYDGLVLAAGSFPMDRPPVFHDAQATGGFWGGRRFSNAVRNGSAERRWLRFRPWAQQVLERVIGDSFYGPPQVVLASLMDWRAAWWYYSATLTNLFQTFWGKFSWGNVRLLGSVTYDLLAVASALAALGALLVILGHVRRPNAFPWACLAFMALAALALWGQALLRGAGSFDSNWVFVPSARYAYPAVLPTVTALTAGWHASLLGAARLGDRPLGVAMGIYFLALLGLTALGMVTVARYFYAAG